MNKINITTIYPQEESGAALYRLNIPKSCMEDKTDFFRFSNYTGFDKINEQGF